MAETIAVFGGGKMGEALIAGLLRGDHAPADVRVVEKQSVRADHLARTYGIRAVDADAAVTEASVLLLVTKPADLLDLVGGISAAVGGHHLVISVAAGITTARIEGALPDGTAVVRCMPNTPALVSEGMTAIAPGANADAAHLDLAEKLLGAVGRLARVTEAQLDAVTGLSGSGPAYFFAMVEAMVDAGVLVGLPRALAAELVVQTIVGSGVLLRDSGQSATALREAVTSPGGTTAAALRELDERGLRPAMTAAVEAATRRSRELSG